MTIKLSEQTANAMNGWMTDEGDVRLPFPAPIVWVLNGSAQFKPIGGTLYMGGWATSADELEETAAELGLSVPEGMTKHEYTPKTGEALNVYSARHIMIAPIAKRLSSTTKDGARFPGYHKGASPHIQVLVMLGYKKGTAYVPWGPVVLSAKGYQCGYLLDALQDWESKSAKARREFAPGVRAELFWSAIGTFGDKPTYKTVGKEGAQSSISPISVFVPKEFNEALLSALFVGEDLAKEMLGLRQQANEWYEAWKSPKVEVATPSTNGGDEPPLPEEQQPEEEVIPF